ncbi:MAG: CrcB family protein [Fusobacteria bacterium]|nr:CrcB family protein [Fusobacteriota bacterium]
MPKLYFFILAVLGGALGSVCRFLFAYANTLILPHDTFIATLLVNILGCLVIGYLFVFVNLKKHPYLEVFSVVGFCGGFTTYSSFMLDNYQLITAGRIEMFLLYFFISIIICFVFVYIGAFAGHIIHREYKE